MFTLVWFFIAVVLLVLELGHPGLFYCLSFSLGALCAAIASYCGVPPVITILMFVFASGMSWIVLARMVRRLARSSIKNNVYRLEGQTGHVVLQIVPDRFGQVKVGGEIWSARSQGNQHLPEGTPVIVVRVQGAHLVVIPK